VWEEGSGEPLGYLGSLRGPRKWTPFLERLSERRRLIVPSLPGFAGGRGHDQLDTLLDWIAATLDLLDAAGLEGADLIGASAGGTLAAEVGALGRTGKLVLIAPFGLYEASEPVADSWAVRPGDTSLLSAEPELLAEYLAKPEDEDPLEWQVTVARASEAAARLLWPTTDTGLVKRLHRIRVPTLVIWGSDDRLIPASYAKRIADEISGPSTIRSIDAAGHLADLDAPDAVADAVLEFL
jgi:pimeloyl-ACP methyl ester carboxylesterase